MHLSDNLRNQECRRYFLRHVFFHETDDVIPFQFNYKYLQIYSFINTTEGIK